MGGSRPATGAAALAAVGSRPATNARAGTGRRTGRATVRTPPLFPCPCLPSPARPSLGAPPRLSLPCPQACMAGCPCARGLAGRALPCSLRRPPGSRVMEFVKGPPAEGVGSRGSSWARSARPPAPPAVALGRGLGVARFAPSRENRFLGGGGGGGGLSLPHLLILTRGNHRRAHPSPRTRSRRSRRP